MTAASDPIPQSSPGDFLRALFGPALPEGCCACVWTLVDKRSHWITVPMLPGGADPYAGDIYVGMGLVPKETADAYGARGRAKAADVCFVPGVWMDIDVAGEGHEKKRLPPDFATAWRILDECHYPPTMVVHTGGGLHAYWLVEDGFAFDNAEDRDLVERIVEGWQRHVMRIAERIGGYQLDSTYSLSQLLRVPGTLNHKYETARDVVLEQSGGPLYQGEPDLGAYAVDQSAKGAATGSPPAESGEPGDAGPAVDANAIRIEGDELTYADWEALRANIDQFEDVWTHSVQVGDGSLSSFDLSLANMAARSDFSDAKIADLIRSHRLYHNDDKAKAERGDYLKRTIAKARQGQAPTIAPQQASQDNSPEESLAYVNTQLGITIERILHYTNDVWQFEIAEGQVRKPSGEGWVTSVEIANSEQLMNPTRFRQSWYGQTHRMIPRFKSTQWDDVVWEMGRVAEWQDIGADANEQQRIMGLLSRYLTDNQPVLDYSDEVLFSERRPFCHDLEGDIFFFVVSFQEWMYADTGDRADTKHLGKVLRSFGCQPHRENGTNPRTGKATSYHVWRVPVAVREQLGV